MLLNCYSVLSLRSDPHAEVRIDGNHRKARRIEREASSAAQRCIKMADPAQGSDRPSEKRLTSEALY